MTRPDHLLDALGLEPEDLGPDVELGRPTVAEGFAGAPLDLKAALAGAAPDWNPLPALVGFTLRRHADHGWLLCVETADSVALGVRAAGLDHTAEADHSVCVDLRAPGALAIRRFDGLGLLVTGGPTPTLASIAAPAVEVPMSDWRRASEDDWLKIRVESLGATALAPAAARTLEDPVALNAVAAATVAGDLVRLAPPPALDFEALLRGEVEDPVARAVHPWVAALTEPVQRVLAGTLAIRAAALAERLGAVRDAYAPDDPAWCATLVAGLAERDALASVAWTLAALGRPADGPLDALDAEHRAGLLGLVDLPACADARLDRARFDPEAWWAQVLP